MPGRISANSSPPMRATRSLWRQLRRINAAHLPQRLIAHRVAELVVHDLEVIEIGDRDAERLADRERHFDLGREPLHEAAPVGDARQRIFLRLALQPQAALAQHRDQSFLLGVRLFELGGALRHALLEMPAIVLEVLESARVGERARDLLAQLPHQVQVRAGVDAGSRVLHTQQAQHDAVVDQRHGEQRAGRLHGFLGPLPQLRRRLSPVIDEQRLRARHQPAEQAGVDGLEPRGQPYLLAFVHPDIEHAPLAIDEHQVQLVEAEQRARLGQDAFGELVDRGARPAARGRLRTGA